MAKKPAKVDLPKNVPPPPMPSTKPEKPSEKSKGNKSKKPKPPTVGKPGAKAMPKTRTTPPWLKGGW